MQIDETVRDSTTLPVNLTSDIIKNEIFNPIETTLTDFNIEMKTLQSDTEPITEFVPDNKITNEKFNNVESNSPKKEVDDEVVNKELNNLNTTATTQTKIFHNENADYKFFSKYKEYKNKAINAYRQRKIFTLYSYNMVRIRKSLKDRGWIEKCSPNYLRKIQILPIDEILRYAKDGNEYEIVAISKLLNSHPPQFIWQSKYPRIEYKNKSFIFPIRNRIYRSKELDFTSKIGLIGCIELSYWNFISGISEVKSPRHFRLNTKEEQDEFLNDYKTTYCLSLLLYIIEKPSETCFSEYGSVSISVIKFALNRIKSEINLKINCNIDEIIENEINENFNIPIKEFDWKRFYFDCDFIQADVMRFNISNGVDYQKLINDCKECIDEAKQFWPTLKIDGYNNIWIIKPANCCRGNGILIQKSYDEIIEYIKKNSNRKYIVQKYIERPLLIYNTKFDIRQYFLMTISDQFVSIWMYKDCYLRFSSQEYNLKDFKESIHITNNAVQKKYHNSNYRNEKLPQHNMWHLEEFLNYLKENNMDDKIWYENIYPIMRQNIISIVSTSLDETELTPNSFEIYGCDFILDHNYQPFLLEINSTPDMSSSTKVTAKLCPKVLEDLIKVVIDYQNDSQSETGNFQMIFKIQIPKIPLPICLSIIGKSKPIIKVPYDSNLGTKQYLNINQDNNEIKTNNKVLDNISKHKISKNVNKLRKSKNSNRHLNNIKVVQHYTKQIDKINTKEDQIISKRAFNEKSYFNQCFKKLLTNKIVNNKFTEEFIEKNSDSKQEIKSIKNVNFQESENLMQINTYSTNKVRLNSNQKVALTLGTQFAKTISNCDS